MKYPDTCGDAAVPPEVNPDGTLSELSGGQVRQPWRFNVSRVYPGGLVAGSRLPDRLLLYFDEFTRAVKVSHAAKDALFVACLSAVPALFAAMIVLKFGGDGRSVVLAGLVGSAGPVLYSLWRAYFKRWNFYERTEWLDFTDRHWRSRKHFAQERKATLTELVAFDELALVCYYRTWEQGGEYEIAICRLRDCMTRNPGRNCPNFLNLIYSNETRAKAFDSLSALSARWGIACYSWDDGAEPVLNRLPSAHI